MSRRRSRPGCESGYRTGLVGKYLNRYPFGRLPYVLDVEWFVAKRNQTGATVYRDFHAIDQGSPVFVHPHATCWPSAPSGSYARRRRPGRSSSHLRRSAPHPPCDPLRPATSVRADDLPVEESPNVVGALRGAPPWVLERPLPSARAAHRVARRISDGPTRVAFAASMTPSARSSTPSGRGIDRPRSSCCRTTGTRSASTVGGQTVPVRGVRPIPLAVHSPWPVEPSASPVSVVDLAPTILDLARTNASRSTERASRPLSVARARRPTRPRPAPCSSSGSATSRSRVDGDPDGRSEADPVRGRHRGALRPRRYRLRADPWR